jgi:ferredoxin
MRVPRCTSVGACARRSRTAFLLEKDGRVAALVNEPQGELPTDEVIIDLIRRVETRGWSPIGAGATLRAILQN